MPIGGSRYGYYMAVTKNPVFHGWNKHIEIQYHFRQELVLDGKVELDYFTVEGNYVDLFTKSLGPVWINNTSTQSKTSQMLWKFR